MEKRTREPNKPPVRGALNLIIAWVVILSLFWVVRTLGGSAQGTQFSYSDWRVQVEADNIESVEVVVRDQIVRGEFRTPVALGAGQTRQFKVILPFDDPAALVAELAERGVAISAKGPQASWVTYLFSALPWVLLIGFWFYIIRRMQAGGTQALAFGRANPKTVKPETPEVTFEDVAGAEEAKTELHEIIDFLKNPSRFQRLGGRLPKGVLLVGPPGTGKTLLARAVAGEAGVPFYSISGSDFVEMFVGVGAARVRDLFQKGITNAPCIIFIDELDAVGRQRGTGLGGGHDEREQTLNQLLVELDGFDTREGVILLSATNRPDVLDPALLRPGRFDRQIVVDLPDVSAREKILAVHARRLALAADVDLALVARGTPGLSGADLSNIANEAALLAARGGQDVITQENFEDAKDKVMLGAERKSVVLTEAERRLAAYHEAGHTLVNAFIPGMDPIHKVTIVPRGRSLGATFSLPETDRRNYTKEYLLGKIAVAYGGRIAEELIFGDDKITTGAALDFQQATEMARRMITEWGMSDVLGPITVGDTNEQVFLGRTLVKQNVISESTAKVIDAELGEIVRTAYDRASRILRANIDLLHEVASALLQSETLDRRDVDAILAHTARPHRASVPSVHGPPPSRNVQVLS